MGSLVPKRWWLWASLILVLILLDRACGGEVRIATFNIENYPKSASQAAGAFSAIAALDVSIVAVQEITDVVHFAATARSRLGPSWAFVYPEESPVQHVGILYDQGRHRLLSARAIPATVVYPSAKPALEVRLRPRDGGRVVRVITVHLKAGGEHHALRRRQLDALEPVLFEARASRERLVVLGDFNATGPADRKRIAALAEAVDVEWVSEALECTSYWDRSDGCVGSALDHVLSSVGADDIQARGPCRTEGCHARDRCPVFHHQVSDHCPVVLEL